MDKTPENPQEKKAIFLSEKPKKIADFFQNTPMKNPENLTSYGLDTKKLEKLSKSTFNDKNMKNFTKKSLTDKKKAKKTIDFFKESSEKLENLSNNIDFK